MAKKSSYDVVIIGGGPAGYQAAIRSAQYGMKTGLVEKRDTLGGTCLNVGCIPSKHLLHVSHQYASAAHDWEGWGIKGNVKMDVAQMIKSKETVVSTLCRGIDGLMKKNKIDRHVGEARLAADGSVSLDDGKKSFEAKRIVLATGSEVMPLPTVEVDEKRIVSSTGALSLQSVPKRLLVIGGGVIGLELGSVWMRLGAEVTVIEALDQILAGVDSRTARAMQKILEKQGMRFLLNRKVLGAEKKKQHVDVTVSGGKKDEKEEILQADIVLVAIGRRPVSANLGLSEAGVKTDARGFIEVDDLWQTSRSGVFAVGDVIKGPMLAHKAGDEAIALVETWHGRSHNIHHAMIPNIIYTSPECATIGLGEDQLKAEQRSYRKGVFPFLANSRAKIMKAVEGHVTLLMDEKDRRLLGGQIIGPEAGTMIHELAIAMEFGATVDDLALTCHAHPTLNEAIREAAFSLGDGTIHL